jgi:ABC-type proline/glycine betaine transport system substrate-binding protein
MKKLIASLTAVAALMLLAVPVAARAEEKVLGKVVKIEMAAPTAKVATATLQNDAGKTVAITVQDKVTLDKFADKRITVGDEIKCKYEVKEGKNVATFFKKPGGCS